MANITYSAGIATAYGAAVRGGYTGTYDDFCRQQAQYAESAAAVEQAKEDAEAAASEADTSKTAAAGSASAAATSAGQASTSATNAANSATAANASKNAAATSATEAGNSATAAAGSASDAQNSADDAQASADAAAQSAASVDVHTDGNYPEMTVGTSEQLLSTQYVTEKTPYLYRTTGGSSDVGNREYVRGIVGGTVAWNQLMKIQNPFPQTVAGITYTKNADNSITASGTSTGRSNLPINAEYVDLVQGHKYMAWCGFKGSYNTSYSVIVQYNGSTYVTLSANSYSATVFIPHADANHAKLEFVGAQVVGVEANATIYPQMFDLTQMFGTTIADYIYSLEQANAGAGVAFFKKLFPNDYYPYDSGTLKHVSGLSEHVNVGFNLFDKSTVVDGYIDDANGELTLTSGGYKSTDFIRVIGGASYYIKTDQISALWGAWYDADKQYVAPLTTYKNQVKTAPSNACYVRLTVAGGTSGGNVDTLCINLSLSGYRNGEYEPYEKHSYALDSSLTLRGIPKLDAQNHLYYDGDVYEPDGTVTRKYGIVDLGTLTWYYADKQDCFYTYGFREYTKQAPNVICSKYPYVGIYADLVDKSCGYIYGNAICVRDESFNKDTAAFKTAMSGVYLVYEKATPTTEEADPYNGVQICDDFGTEEYVSTSIVPVGHETGYPANLRDKLQHLPDLADTDGSYIISQSNKHMTLAPLPIVVPAPPTTDGTYTFRATVSNGVPTLSWVEE